MRTHCPAAADTEALGGRMARALRLPQDAPVVLYLSGELGAGKTTFARGFLGGLGADGPVRSPTYTLLELYPLPGCTVVHLDLYRLNHAAELEGLGLRDWATPEHVWLVEWPERGGERLPRADLMLALSVGAHGHDVEVSAGSAFGAAWLAALESSAARP
jgi:tRNA threonylcarbamoyladenosine biosynthesis protein TsaE